MNAVHDGDDPLISDHAERRRLTRRQRIRRDRERQLRAAVDVRRIVHDRRDRQCALHHLPVQRRRLLQHRHGLVSFSCLEGKGRPAPSAVEQRQGKQDEIGKGNQETENDQVHEQEPADAPKDLAGRDEVADDAFDDENVHSDRRRDHPDFEKLGQDDAEPDQVDAELLGDRRQQRHEDEGDLEEVEEAAEDEHDDRDDDQEAVFAAGKRQEQFLDPDIAVQSVEGEAEDARTINAMIESVARQAPAASTTCSL